MAVLYAFLYCCDDVNRTIRYFVGNDDISLHMHASEYNVRIQYPVQCTDELVICGKGYAEKRVQCQPKITDQVEFILTIHKKVPNNIEFKMEIKSKKSPELNHDSGFVQINSSISDLHLVVCC